jgi:hypothetical protein
MPQVLYHVEKKGNLLTILPVKKACSQPVNRKPWWKRLLGRWFGDPVRIASKTRYQGEVTPSVLGTETDIINLADQSDDYIVEGQVSLQNMASGDAVELKVYIAVDGVTQVVSDKLTFTDAQEIPVVRVVAHTLLYNAKFRVTVNQTAGTLRAFPYAFLVQVMEVI